MSVDPQVNPDNIVDRDPLVPGSGTPFSAAALNPIFDELATAHNSHTHTEYALEDDLASHEVDTTGIHGIVDTAALVLAGDARLADKRISPDNSITSAQIIDGSIAVGDLAFDPATQTELDAEATARANAITLAVGAAAGLSLVLGG